ncbi:hypothetical protein D3C78_1444970 [compost metagenome]
MAIVEGQLERVLPGWLKALQADIQLAVLEDRVAVALDLRRRRMHPEEFGAQAVALAGAVFQLQGFRGFVQLDRGGEAHRRDPGESVGASFARESFEARRFASRARSYGFKPQAASGVYLAACSLSLVASLTEYTATDLRPAPVRRGGC